MDLIIALLFAFRLGKLAEANGLSKKQWIIKTVVHWMLSEIIIMVIGVMMLGYTEKSVTILSFLGIAAGFAGYLLAKQKLEKAIDEQHHKN